MIDPEHMDAARAVAKAVGVPVEHVLAAHESQGKLNETQRQEVEHNLMASIRKQCYLDGIEPPASVDEMVRDMAEGLGLISPEQRRFNEMIRDDPELRKKADALHEAWKKAERG